MLELSVHPEVEGDYEAALTWYLARSRKAAIGFIKEVVRIIESIQENPESNPSFDDRHRYALLKKYPFSIIYRLDSDRIRVIALAHSKRSEEFWRKRR